ncbi:hypothetical protein [Paraburkholderia phenazinium]|jgi:hypothetical protein|uniref:Lipoprotein n=1 Tax=Paraburkholderia phenazinium TaxID=60549 RepID=A0A1G7SCT1_9BURK|nr:hypothetical protein [Paraburkholderia phenazinium]SDG20781.1 hypothetical protein SAMN05216466_102471 [Paraburkholderia phenazinium]
MKNQKRIWMLIALSLITALSACILVPAGGDHHGGDYHGGDYHGGGDYQAHDHY